MQGREQDSVEDLGAWLKELNSRDRVSEIAEAWMQDDPKWRAQELAYDALEANGLEEALYLAGEAQKLDPECTDAQRLMVDLLPTSPENRLHLMREVVATAERNLGESFEQDAGHFWLKVSTRPYMRAAQHLGELLAGAGQFDEAAAIFDRMLDLNPKDNQGMRFPLLCMYLATGNPEGAVSVLSRFPGQEGFIALFAWGRTMERFLSGNLVEAEAALERARRVNPFVEKYVLGAKPPDHGVDYYRPGDEYEAEFCGWELRSALMNHPDFRQWVRSHRP